MAPHLSTVWPTPPTAFGPGCKLYGVRKSQTTPYHPAGNGACKRFNRTLIQLLSILNEEQKGHWPEYITELLFSYNSTVHSVTGYTPFYMMYGRHSRLPLDLALGTVATWTEEPTDGWLQRHYERLQYANQCARKNLQQANAHQKQWYVTSSTACPLLPSERVLVKRQGPKAHGKLTDCYEELPYVVVVGQPNPRNPVYVVHLVRAGGKERVLHRNLLYPCNFNLSEGRPMEPEPIELLQDPLAVPMVMVIPDTGVPPTEANEVTNLPTTNLLVPLADDPLEQEPTDDTSTGNATRMDLGQTPVQPGWR